MPKLQRLFIRLALHSTRWQLRLLFRDNRFFRKRYLYQSANLFYRTGRLIMRQKSLEEKLSTLQGGDME